MQIYFGQFWLKSYSINDMIHFEDDFYTFLQSSLTPQAGMQYWLGSLLETA